MNQTTLYLYLTPTERKHKQRIVNSARAFAVFYSALLMQPISGFLLSIQMPTVTIL